MNHLERALGRAKNHINLSSAERASLRQALEWKVKPVAVRIPEDYRHQVWWRGLALVLPLIVIFIAARQVGAPEPAATPQVMQETAPLVAPPVPVMLKRAPAPEVPVAPFVPQIPTLPSSAGAPASDTNLLRATSTATTSVEELPEDNYNN